SAKTEAINQNPTEYATLSRGTDFPISTKDCMLNSSGAAAERYSDSWLGSGTARWASIAVENSDCRYAVLCSKYSVGYVLRAFHHGRMRFGHNPSERSRCTMNSQVAHMLSQPFGS